MEEQNNILKESVMNIKGIGPKRAQDLKGLNIHTLKDLLYYIPRMYKDRSQITAIENAAPGQEITLWGNIQNLQKTRSRRGMTIAKIIFTDGTGIACATYFKQPYILQQYKPGDSILVSGRVNEKMWKQYGRVEVSHPIIEKERADSAHSGRIVPVYSLTKGITETMMRTWVAEALRITLPRITETLPETIIHDHGLLSRREALRSIHFPVSWAEQENAFRRLAFEECFFMQLYLAQAHFQWKDQKGYIHENKGTCTIPFLQNLPFSLTASQKKVWREIQEDMARPQPMHRLLQGDVGSGKTVLALLALLRGIENGYQGAFMAPTEILAEQHCTNLQSALKDLGVKVALLTGKQGSGEKEKLLTAIAKGHIDLIIGTHALIQERVKFSALGIVVIDEQHRFGVKQRQSLQKKEAKADVLVMTATPIPRTLTMTFYGDLDVSTIDQLPPGRKQVITRWRRENRRSKIYAFMEKEIQEGRQAFVVCPLVEESKVMGVEATEHMYHRLKTQIFPQFRVEMIHGQIHPRTRQAIMKSFREGLIDILVATTVIEVGVDIPGASIMLIEDAQRFGLAQLHQLRGRVGRNDHQSYCILLSETQGERALKRMKIMETTNDGFVLAEQDLEIRGPGELFGMKQHGFSLFTIADPIKDRAIIQEARHIARAWYRQEGLTQEVQRELEENRKYYETIVPPTSNFPKG